MPLDPTAFLADPELLRALSERAKPMDCSTDCFLFHQDDPPTGIYILHQGKVTLSMLAHEGKAILTVEARDGSLLGLPGLIGNEPYSLTAVASAGARISFLDRNEFYSLMQSNPTLSFKILQVLAAEVRSARNALCNCFANF